MTASPTSGVVARAAAAPATLFDVSGQSALVTGATGAFGLMAAATLAAAGARVTLAGGDRNALESIAADLRSDGASVALVQLRPDDEADAEAIVEAAVRAHGGLDIVVQASGMNKTAPIVEQSLADWDEVMGANVRGAWLVCRAAGRQMIEQERGGKVVLVSSTRGRLGHAAGYSAYSPSKGAINLLARTLACEWGSAGITVNAIAPTVFRSRLTAWMYADDGPGREVREEMLGRIPLGRLGETEDFAGALLYFASRASDFCTGQVLYVDGGYTAG